MRCLSCLFVIGPASSSRVGARAYVRPGQGYIVIPTVGRKRPYGTMVLYELEAGLLPEGWIDKTQKSVQRMSTVMPGHAFPIVG